MAPAAAIGKMSFVLVWTTTPVTPKSTSDFGFPKLLFDFYLLGICGRRDRIGHVDNAGNAAADSRGGARGEVFFVGHAGLSEVNVAINDAREDMFALSVDFLFALRQLVIRADRDDLLAADRHAAFERFPWVSLPSRF